MNSEVTVVIPTHNPDPDRLRSTLLGLKGQTLPPSRWNTVLVNNASSRFPDDEFFSTCAPSHFAIVGEPQLGLTAARVRGFQSATGSYAVLVDDDNILAPDYLEQVISIFDDDRRVGLAGGKSFPKFAAPPPEWTREFFPLLALRDLGDVEQISEGLRPGDSLRNEYPAFAPIGAGMALRREAWTAWLDSRASLSDRRGGELSSSGDNDIVLCAMEAGWEAGYFPQLSLTHLIPAGRLEAEYLERLNRGIQKSWMQVLALHDASDWPPLTPIGALFRKMKSWLTYRAWSSTAARIRWQGACGHFDGRVGPPAGL